MQFFRKGAKKKRVKKGKIFENLGKNCTKFENILKKCATIACMKQLEYALYCYFARCKGLSDADVLRLTAICIKIGV